MAHGVDAGGTDQTQSGTWKINGNEIEIKMDDDTTNMKIESSFQNSKYAGFKVSSQDSQDGSTTLFLMKRTK